MADVERTGEGRLLSDAQIHKNYDRTEESENNETQRISSTYTRLALYSHAPLEPLVLGRVVKPRLIIEAAILVTLVRYEYSHVWKMRLTT